MGLLRRILDNNKRVQKASCSAFATLEEEAAEELVPRLDVILQHLLCAFGKYQRRNLRILYDAIGTLADAVGVELNQPMHLDVLMPPLIAKWQQLSNADKDLFPLLECFTSIDQVSRSNLRDLLLQCCMDDAPDIRQSAFALLGDLARVCLIHLHQRLPEFLDVASKQQVRLEISPIVMTVILSFVPILQHTEGLIKSLIENSSITLGRLAWVCPELVSPHMEHFMQSWCIALSMICDDIEKEDAFRGLCTMVRSNPSGALSSLAFMFEAIASWHEIRSEELQNEIFQVLLGYKQMLGNGAWEQCMSSLESPVKEKLSKYQV